MPEIVVKRQHLNRLAIDEIEKNSIAKCYEKYIHLLETDPENFPYLDNLKKVESNAYYLAKEYIDGLKKNLVSRNDEIQDIADRLINDSDSYKIIHEFNESSLKNKIKVKLLIDIVRDRVDSAYQLAKYREKCRRLADFEDILARLEHYIAHH